MSSHLRKEGKERGSSRDADPRGDGPSDWGGVQRHGLVQRDAEHTGGMLDIPEGC